MVPTDSRQFQKSHFQSIEKRTMLDRDNSRVRERYNYKNSNGYQTYDRKDYLMLSFVFHLFALHRSTAHNLRHCIIVRRATACIPPD